MLKAKFSAYPLVTIVKQEIVDDQPQKITVAIKKMLAQGLDLIVCTGGMSVDPDDLTPLAIKQTGAEIVTHGTPVLPGSMFLLAYKGEQTIIGLPGGVLFSEKTVFDLLIQFSCPNCCMYKSAAKRNSFNKKRRNNPCGSS